MRNKFARCLSNPCYIAWILGSFMLSFYSSMLPSRPAFDFVHYRNYFQMSVVLVIVLQELNYKRLHLQTLERRSYLSSICMDEFTTVPSSAPAASKKEDGEESEHAKMEKVDAGGDEGEDGEDEDEEVVFDRPQLDMDRSAGLVFTVKQMPRSTQMSAGSARASAKSAALESIKKGNTFKQFVDNNQTRIVVVFALLLVAQLVLSAVVLWRSATFSAYVVLSQLVLPLVILISYVLRNHAFNCIF